MKRVLAILILPLKVLAWGLVILTPALGVWVASSLAAYLGGPVWLACFTGLLLFPAGPLAWDLWGSRRFDRKQEERESAGKEPRKRLVTFGDRLILRTFFLNFAFVAMLLAASPQAGFTALATRGDWFLDQWKSPRAKVVRPVVFAAAEKLEWVYQLSRENPYERFDDDEPLPTPKPDEFGDAETQPDVVDPEPERPTIPTPPSREPGEPPRWPMEATLHPVVANMPDDVKSSYQDVARYIAANETDPFLRVKALNDFVADRVAYDVPALRSGNFGPQDAKTVFDAKKGVCAGYSKLMAAMAEITGDEIVYIGGVSRDDKGGVAGGGHAWNAARIEGKWYLLDATWNAGHVDGDTFTKKYRTEYLFTPPEIFSGDHLPNDEGWQLRTKPLTRGEFIRQPMITPEVHAQGLRRINPQRSQIDATADFVEVHLENREGRRVFANIASRDGGTETKCSTNGARDIIVRCAVGAEGTHELKLFAGPPQLSWFPLVGRFEVVAR